MMAPCGGDTGTDPEHTGGCTNPTHPGNKLGFPKEVVGVMLGRTLIMDGWVDGCSKTRDNVGVPK